jgi:predicted DCC family thiol-disulfide oxidoreductase YuxK
VESRGRANYGVRVKHAWTGGQYSLWRVLCAVLGTVALVSFAGASPPVLLGGLAALALALGWHDRIAAFALAAAWIGCGAAAPARGAIGITIACALLLHSATPPKPFGSLDAVGRTDPSGSWIRPAWMHAVAWILLAAVDVYSVAALAGRELITSASWSQLAWLLALAPLAIPPRALRWVWCASIAFYVVTWATGRAIGFDAFSLASLIVLHALAFDPGWIQPRDPLATELVFYDGGCGLCHRLVRFLLAEDRRARAFRFAPLHGELYRARISESLRATLPDSLIVCTRSGEVLTRSRAVIHAMEQLGGVWRALAACAAIVPAAMLDAGYDWIARTRHRLFAAPPSACPMLPAHLLRRFEG